VFPVVGYGVGILEGLMYSRAEMSIDLRGKKGFDLFQ
jgi:hypothetical protein